MNFDDLVRHWGSAPKAAAALRVRRQTVHRWKDGGIPLMRQYHIQTLTAGALKVDAAADEAQDEPAGLMAETAD